jgi:IS66 C-terminal element
MTAASNSTTTPSSAPSARLHSAGRTRCSLVPTEAPSIGPPSPLIETGKLNDIDPLAYLTDVLTSIANGHPKSRIDELLPWAYRKQELKAVA